MQVAGADGNEAVVIAGPRARADRRDRRRARAEPGQKVKFYVDPEAPRSARRRRRGGPVGRRVSGRAGRGGHGAAAARTSAERASRAARRRFNISRWALEHPALTRYLLIVLLVLGAAAYFQLGQDEDPPFTFRAMAMRVFWPGATAQQVAEQVTDKLEKTLQEVPYADKIRSYSKPGEALILFQVQRLVAAEGDAADLVHGAQEDRRHARARCRRAWSGRSSTTSSATSTARSTRSRPTASATQELKDHADRVRQRLLKVQDVNKVAIFGAQDEKVFVEISQKRLAQLGLDFNQVLAQLGQQNAVESAGAINAPHRLRAGARRRPVQLGRRAAALPDPRRRREPSSSATSPRSGAATSIRRRSRCATRARR